MSTTIAARASSSSGTAVARRSPGGALVYSNLTDSSLMWFLVIGVSLTVLSAVGSTSKIVDGVIASDQSAVDEAGLRFLRFGFALLLFVSMWGASRVTTEFRDATIATRIAEGRGVGRVVVHHALASLPGGVIFGVTGLLCGAVPGYLILRQHDMTMTINGEFYRTALGIVLVSTLAAPWGTSFGWLLRRTIPSVLVIVAWTTFLEPIIVNWFPGRVAKYLPGNLQSTLVLDPKAVGSIHQAPATALLVAWIVALSAIVFAWTRNRDLHG